MTRDLEYPLEISLGDGEPTRAQRMDVIHDMVRLTIHWIVSDCDLGKAIVYTPSRNWVV